VQNKPGFLKKPGLSTSDCGITKMKKKITDKKVNDFIQKYLAKIKATYEPQQIWLWGSRAYGTPHEYSDIDLIVVSQSFADERFIQRMPAFLRKLGLVTDRSVEVVDVLCYTPDEFERKKNQISIVREAVNKGIRII
jgi:predicted nucleotidyltransferase